MLVIPELIPLRMVIPVLRETASGSTGPKKRRVPGQNINYKLKLEMETKTEDSKMAKYYPQTHIPPINSGL